MNKQHPYALAYSPCPNDTFIFKALARKLIDLHGYRFNIVLEDVETLNQQAKMGVHDITKLSFAAF
nr:1,4-dihydroxy-6-naphthoate synthase [Desulfobacula sp.]